MSAEMEYLKAADQMVSTEQMMMKSVMMVIQSHEIDVQTFVRKKFLMKHLKQNLLLMLLHNLYKKNQQLCQKKKAMIEKQK